MTNLHGSTAITKTLKSAWLTGLREFNLTQITSTMSGHAGIPIRFMEATHSTTIENSQHNHSRGRQVSQRPRHTGLGNIPYHVTMLSIEPYHRVHLCFSRYVRTIVHVQRNEGRKWICLRRKLRLLERLV